jgi:hypothetical protein
LNGNIMEGDNSLTKKNFRGWICQSRESQKMQKPDVAIYCFISIA